MTLEEQFVELEKLRREMLDSLEPLDDSLLRQSRNGEWCALQIIDHLTSAEERSLAYISKKLQDPASIPKAGLGVFFRTLALGIALRLPFRYGAPPALPPPVAAASLRDARARWDEVRSGWKSLVGTVSPEIADRALFRHPVAGRMNLRDTLRFHRQHLMRHRSQIEQRSRSTE